MEELKPPQQPKSIDLRKNNAESQDPAVSTVPNPTVNAENIDQIKPLITEEVREDQADTSTLIMNEAGKETPEEVINVIVGPDGAIDGSKVENLIRPEN